MTPAPGNQDGPIFLRFHGPGKFRFIVQPAIAIFLGIRDGIQDAKAGQPPYFWHLLLESKNRRELFKSALSALSKPLVIAFAIDSLFQILILARWRPLGALLVGIVFLGLPYVSARGLANRIASRRFRKQQYERRDQGSQEKRVA